MLKVGTAREGASPRSSYRGSTKRIQYYLTEYYKSFSLLCNGGKDPCAICGRRFSLTTLFFFVSLHLLLCGCFCLYTVSKILIIIKLTTSRNTPLQQSATLFTDTAPAEGGQTQTYRKYCKCPAATRNVSLLTRNEESPYPNDNNEDIDLSFIIDFSSTTALFL